MYYFNGVFPGGTKGLALLIWRFFTYYLFLFTGVVMVLLEKFGPSRVSYQTRTLCARNTSTTYWTCHSITSPVSAVLHMPKRWLLNVFHTSQ